MTYFLLLIGLLFLHYITDFTKLSTPNMLSAKRFGTPLLPIWYHGLIHATLMTIYLSIFTKNIPFLCTMFLLECITHFSIDVLKGKCNKWFPIVQSPSNVEHWNLFGFDQFLHQLVIVIIYFLTITFNTL